jgi:predicted RNase H-like HicB family nuclease
MVIDSFNSKIVSKIIGIPLRVIDYWDRTNFIKPSVKEASGYGSIRLYSFTDLIQFRVAGSFRNKGLSLQKMRKSLHFLRKHLPEVENPLAKLSFLTDGDTLFLLTNKDQEIVDTVKNGQGIFSIAIEGLVNEIKEKASKIKKEKSYTVIVAKRKFEVILHPDLEEGGFWVECQELPGCSSQGDSAEEALDMIKDAIKGHLAVEEEMKKEVSPRRKAG